MGAVGNAAKNVLNHLGTEIRIELVERNVAAERAIGCDEPRGGVGLVADHQDGVGKI